MLSRQALLRTARTAVSQRAALSQTRAYAAAATSSEKVLPPVALFGLDGTYATALYTAAVKTSSLEPTARALASVGTVVEKDPKLASLLGAPQLTAADKSAIVGELLKVARVESDANVKNFLATLAENNRLGLLPSVVTKFTELMSAARGEVEMVVTTAQALDNKSLGRLETAVSKSSYVGAGKKLKVTNTVNPDIVGGLIVEIGDRTIDLSVSSKIHKMNKLLTDTL
ncbi:ATP synthase delta subunit-domain-containing protein [Schizothecium vesticola]|uniref:ATP synthase subunit 5, mitochondrial n=1 Tax=Schizothecium vesticola TaxID=314040 RepID=A0AA40K073_9PEZI|nr:ATP synthase delta subunit-domain-containing protein [Schizothecium vesticola]